MLILKISRLGEEVGFLFILVTDEGVQLCSNIANEIQVLEVFKTDIGK